MLAANNYKSYFYTHYNKEKQRNDIVIDFLLSNNSKLKYKLYPFEVKSSMQYMVSFLWKFKEKYRDRIRACYIIYPKNLSLNKDIVCIPLT